MTQAVREQLDRSSKPPRDQNVHALRLVRPYHLVTSAPQESARWEGLLDTLDHPPGRLSREQIAMVRSIWDRARTRISRLRPPAAGMTEDGEYFLSWNFEDLRGVTLEVTVIADGRVEWFFRDRANSFVTGTEGDPEADLPPVAFSHLRAFLGRPVIL